MLCHQETSERCSFLSLLSGFSPSWLSLPNWIRCQCLDRRFVSFFTTLSKLHVTLLTASAWYCIDFIISKSGLKKYVQNLSSSSDNIDTRVLVFLYWFLNYRHARGVFCNTDCVCTVLLRQIFVQIIAYILRAVFTGVLWREGGSVIFNLFVYTVCI